MIFKKIKTSKYSKCFDYLLQVFQILDKNVYIFKTLVCNILKLGEPTGKFHTPAPIYQADIGSHKRRKSIQRLFS